MEDSNMQQLDYNGLLMNHLNRLSFVTTGGFIDALNKGEAEKFQNPSSMGLTSLEWGVRFLYAVVPNDLKDKQLEKKNQEIKKKLFEKKAHSDSTPEEVQFFQNHQSKVYQFEMLKSVINLLHRNGLLITTKVSGRAFTKKDKGKIPDSVFEE